MDDFRVFMAAVCLAELHPRTLRDKRGRKRETKPGRQKQTAPPVETTGTGSNLHGLNQPFSTCGFTR